MSKNYLDLGGTIRCCSASETLQKLKPILSKVGITRVANVTGLDNINIPTATCIRPNSKHLTVSQGKGLTLELAKISAIMESIEGYHAENPSPPNFIGSFNELTKKQPVIDPTSFNPGFLSSQDLRNIPIPWIKALELFSDKTVYIPHALLCLDSSTPHLEYAYLQVSSNGLASGNSLQEATCHALYEIIERDAISKWLQKNSSEQKKTQINLTTIDSAINNKLLEKFNTADVNVYIWDITSDLGIPTYRCVIESADLFRSLGTFFGFGAHLSKEVALARAITEAAQTRLTLISGSRDDVFPSYYEKNLFSSNLRPKSEETGNGTMDFKKRLQPPLQHSFAENLQTTLQILKNNNLKQICLVDHTKPKINIPVVHAFIPGLQFIGSRHGA